MMFREGQAPRPTKSGRDSADAKQTERSLKGKGVGAKRGDSAVLEGQCDKPIVHRRTIISDFIIIAHFGKVNESYKIVTIWLA